MRFFRCLAGDFAYEQARLTLDAAWGHPNATTGTVTCIDPAGIAPHDPDGRILLAVNDEFCEYSAAALMLAEMLASGAVSEITEAEYREAVGR